MVKGASLVWVDVSPTLWWATMSVVGRKRIGSLTINTASNTPPALPPGVQTVTTPQMRLGCGFDPSSSGPEFAYWNYHTALTRPKRQSKTWGSRDLSMEILIAGNGTPVHRFAGISVEVQTGVPTKTWRASGPELMQECRPPLAHGWKRPGPRARGCQQSIDGNLVVPASATRGFIYDR